ncbi:POLR1A (predicted), partial [Pycnogonum litorale]
ISTVTLQYSLTLARIFRMADRKVPHYQMSKIRFSAYSAKEICQLSVVEVVNPESFDIIGHPTKGGLYDPAFGPCEPNAVCVTCGLNHLSCPGHVGHIALPLPVYNPFFFRTLYQLLKGSCFSCGCLLSSEIAVSLILAQLQALDYGLVGLAEELEEIISEEDNQQAKTLRAVIVKEKLEKRLAAAFDGMDIDEARRSAHVKNVVERRQKITKHFLKTYVMGGSKKCPRCRKTQAGLATQHNCRIVFTNTSRKNEAFKP